jgi:hypothetical protein
MQAYVSSTFSDLRPYRDAAFESLAQLGLRATGPEFWSSSEAVPVERCIDAVRAADFVVLVVGHRYGFVPEGYDASITQIEYATAIQQGKDVLVFLLSEDVPVRVGDVERDPELSRKLASFRSVLIRRHAVSVVKSVQDFQNQLTAALVTFARTPVATMPEGKWQVRAGELETELDRQKEVIRELQERLTRVVPANPIWKGRRFSTDELSCFVLMPFQDTFFEMYEAAVVPAVERCGLSAKHAGEIFGNREVIEDIWDSICSARVIVVDVTGRNPNVFYELGVCHTLGKECVVITQTDSDVPFDIRHRRYLRYDVKKPKLLTANLERTIRAVLTTPGADVV